jgi:hypothetical protein
MTEEDQEHLDTIDHICAERDRYKEALRAIVELSEKDKMAYLFDPTFHATIEIARLALEAQ